MFVYTLSFFPFLRCYSKTIYKFMSVEQGHCLISLEQVNWRYLQSQIALRITLYGHSWFINISINEILEFCAPFNNMLYKLNGDIVSRIISNAAFSDRWKERIRMYHNKMVLVSLNIKEPCLYCFKQPDFFSCTVRTSENTWS